MNPNLRLRCLYADPGDLGRRLRETRLAAGLTQAQVSAGVVSSAYLSRVETGQRRPAPEVMAALAERLGTSVEGLLEGTTVLQFDPDTVPWPEHLRALNAARATSIWLRRPRDAKAYRRMLTAVAAWEAVPPLP